MIIIGLLSHGNIINYLPLKAQAAAIIWPKQESKDEPAAKVPSAVRKPVKMEVSYRPEI